MAGALSAVWRLESSVAEPPRRGGLADVRGLSVAPTGGKASGAPPRVSAVRVGAVRWAPCGGLALWWAQGAVTPAKPREAKYARKVSRAR